MFKIDTGIREDGDPRDLLARKRVDLDGSLPALRPCRYCESVVGVLTGPKGPHHDGVRCETCYRHLGWLPPPDGADLTLIEG